MKVQGIPYRTIWLHPNDPCTVRIIDQRALPHRFVIEDLHTAGQMTRAIQEMHLRGAPLIGAAAAYGVYLAALEAPRHRDPETFFDHALARLAQSRPTAVNLHWALSRMKAALNGHSSWEKKAVLAKDRAAAIADDDVKNCEAIGRHFLPVIENLARKKAGPVNILTHCNAGWLACVDWGTATSGIYQAHDKGLQIHVWVDETRPRNQGASLTAWELASHGVPHTVICDNAGGHLMQHGKVDIVITGSDRSTRTGDAANKIGTYLKALAARDNHIPFYIALPASTIDWSLTDGIREIPIEERSQEEVRRISGLYDGALREVLLVPEASPAANPGFDVTPARLITGLVTERGISEASEAGLLKLFPEQAAPVRDEGVIKFHCDWTRSGALKAPELKALNACRKKLFDLGLIGVYPDGIGFGNVSLRETKNTFLVTGTQTGHLPELTADHYTRVMSYDIARNRVVCEGPVKASSESLTHAMLYDLNPEIGAVVHVHHHRAWKDLCGRIPTTAAEVPYGTPAMAVEVRRLYEAGKMKTCGIFVMAGHEDGIVSFGRGLEEALELLLKTLGNHIA